MKTQIKGQHHQLGQLLGIFCISICNSHQRHPDNKSVIVKSPSKLLGSRKVFLKIGGKLHKILISRVKTIVGCIDYFDKIGFFRDIPDRSVDQYTSTILIW
ncbi:Hypothetical protein PP7435_CHR1-2071 [Komagataella phaffii CBS 7435]|uniref:Uncharacterized protein n=1 Tax=Komagataella phaffii (strain ATCC 76273 / CBS 7435 / CECT 11047 / NRRL Y-11430 / Wegner 21-1) TaxID=981350 RepID=A0A1G4KP75_KOMPC|nr:GQ67_02713T0 [Komagataella phaffii]AOA65752.1 GQ68_02535T0 [Komagataella phaffii GS115]CAH2446168.1 Hypothetical protein BQ9382_C1-2308 [Komagataella phaffii CBS 7435]SCV11804.1 Hypothetical protein PP7435_CHR1-2071 [Komagataella phaffii CBS 7435]